MPYVTTAASNSLIEKSINTFLHLELWVTMRPNYLEIKKNPDFIGEFHFQLHWHICISINLAVSSHISTPPVNPTFWSMQSVILTLWVTSSDVKSTQITISNLSTNPTSRKYKSRMSDLVEDKLGFQIPAVSLTSPTPVGKSQLSTPQFSHL